MAYFVADSYKGFEFDETKAYEKSGKLYVRATQKCDRCVNGVFVCRVENGEPVAHPAYNGVCLKCGGTGIISKEIRLYNEKEKAAMDRQTEARANKKDEARRAELAKLQAESEQNKRAWMEKEGFADIVYCVGGDNTYAIKDKLKELGCRFNPVLKWYATAPVDIPIGYTVISFSFDDLYEWSPMLKKACPKSDAAARVEQAFREAEGPSLSEHMGTVGERLRDITAIFHGSRGFEGRFGYTYIHTFTVGDNVLTWFTAKELAFEIGAVINITGTVKDHTEYNGVKQTVLNRCIIREIA